VETPVLLGALTSPDYAALAPTAVAIVPIGAIEPHGPHLPLASDTLISDYFAQRLAGDLTAAGTAVVIAPTIGYGVHTPPQRLGGLFPGMITISGDTLTRLTGEVLAALARDGVRNIVLLNSAYASTPFLCEAARQLTDHDPGVRVMIVAWWEVVGEAFRDDLAAETGVPRTEDHHAGMVESSLVIHIAPHHCQPDRLGPAHGAEQAARRLAYHRYPLPDDAVTASGIVYTAANAGGDLGERVADQAARALAAAVALEFGLTLPDKEAAR
jgi:creatinine amidohydrolase